MTINFIIVLLSVILFGFHCDKISKPETSKKVLFSLHTGSRDSLSRIYVSFNSYDTLDELPTITIGTSLPDTIEYNIGFYRATFRDVHSDSTVHYKLKLYGDSIFDQFMVPGEIDSLFCNNHFIFGNYSDSTIYIDTASNYLFSWKTKKKGDYFLVEYYGDLNNDRDGTKSFITKDTVITITPEKKDLPYSFLKFKLENCQGSQNPSVPNISSEKIDIYYEIRSTRYTCHIYMN